MSTEKRCTKLVPSRALQALKKAVMHLYCCDDLSVIGKLGSGFFASVYLVNHRPSNVDMALKISNEGNVLRREIEFLGRLRHDNVQRLYGACVVSGRLACLSEYANGGSLADLLTCSTAPLSWSARVSIAHDIISGINHLHENQLIHRDLSSQNILIRVNHPPDWSASDKGRGSNGILLVRDVRRLPPVSHGGSSSNAHSSPFLSPGGSCGAISPSTEHISSSFHLHHSPQLSTEQVTVRTSRGTGSTRRHSAINTSPNVQQSWICQLPKVAPLVLAVERTATDGSDYTAIVGDLGCCLDLQDKTVDPTITTGNPFCTAPECLRKLAPYTTAADIFSFGLLLCELMTGLINNGLNLPRTPDFGLDANELPVLPDCPSWLLQLVTRCCTVNFWKRPNASELAALLFSKLNLEGTTSRPRSPGSCLAKHALQPSPSTSGLILKVESPDVSPPKRQSVLTSTSDASDKVEMEPITIQHSLSLTTLSSLSSTSCCSIATVGITAQSFPPPPKAGCALYSSHINTVSSSSTTSNRIVLPPDSLS